MLDEDEQINQVLNELVEKYRYYGFKTISIFYYCYIRIILIFSYGKIETKPILTIVSAPQSCRPGLVPARRLAGHQAVRQARLNFLNLSWPDQAVPCSAWPAVLARPNLLAWI